MVKTTSARNFKGSKPKKIRKRIKYKIRTPILGKTLGRKK